MAGSALGDTLAAISGHDVNRQGLNAFVDSSQAQNALRAQQTGLVSQQTQEAMLNAQRMQEEADARARLPGALQQMLGPNAHASDGQTMADLMINKYGSAKDVLDVYNRATLSNPALLGTGAQTAAQQGIEGKVATPFGVQPSYATLPGAFQPNVQQTPAGAAQTADTLSQTAQREALAKLALAKAQNPGGAMDPDAIAFGGYQLFKTGQMPALGMGNGQAKMAMLSEAQRLSQMEAQNPGSSINPAFETAINNHQDYTAGQRALNSFAGGPLSNQARAINNSVGHLSLIENLWNAVQNGDIQGINKLDNAWQKQTGHHAPTDVQTAATVLGPELAKVMANNGGAGTGEERQEFSQLVGNLANSPEQATNSIQTLKGMLGRQASDLALQYSGATGRNDFATRYLAPDTRQYLDLNPQTGAQGTPPATSAGSPNKPIQIHTDADYNALPSGALFVAPDGKTRRKP